MYTGNPFQVEFICGCPFAVFSTDNRKSHGICPTFPHTGQQGIRDVKLINHHILLIYFEEESTLFPQLV